MTLEDKHIALETELIVAKDAIWGLTERVINLETEIKKLTTIILNAGDKIDIRPLLHKNSISRNFKSTGPASKTPVLKSSKSKSENKSAKRKRSHDLDNLEVSGSQADKFSTEEHEAVTVKIERSDESPNEDSYEGGDNYPNENEYRDFENVVSSAGETKSEAGENKLKRPSRTKTKGGPSFQRASNDATNPNSEIQSTFEAEDSDSDSNSLTQKKFKVEATLKRGDPDPIWRHWKRVSKETEKRVIVQCIYCSSHDQLNHATKCKRHTAVCKSAPLVIKNEFSQWKDYGKGMRVRKPKSDEPESEPT